MTSIFLLLLLFTSPIIAEFIGTLSGSTSGYVDDPAGANVQYNQPTAADMLDIDGTMLLVADYYNGIIRKVDTTTGGTTTFAGQQTNQGRLDQTSGSDFLSSTFIALSDIKIHHRYDQNQPSKSVTIFVAQSDYSQGGLRRLSYIPSDPNSYVVTTLDVPDPYQDYQACQCIATESHLDHVYAIYYLLDGSKVLFVRITSATSGTPTISILAEVTRTSTAANGPSTTATVINPTYLTIDTLTVENANPDLLFTDATCIRRITTDTAAGISITTVSGDCAIAGSTDDIGTSARYGYPMGIQFLPVYDNSAYIFVVDSDNNVIKQIFYDSTIPSYSTSLFSGQVTTPSHTETTYANPINIYYDGIRGVMYVMEAYSPTYHTIRKVTGVTMITYDPFASSTSPPTPPPAIIHIDTLSGGTSGYVDDTNPAVVQYNNPIAMDFLDVGKRKLLIADRNNDVIRLTDVSSLTTTTWAGSNLLASNTDQTSGTDFITTARFISLMDLKVLKPYNPSDPNLPVVVYVAQKTSSTICSGPCGIRRLKYIPSDSNSYEVTTIDITGLTVGYGPNYHAGLALAIDSSHDTVYALIGNVDAVDQSMDHIILIQITQASMTPVVTLLGEILVASSYADGDLSTAAIARVGSMTLDTLQAVTSTTPDLYFTDQYAIRKITTSSISITTVSGDGTSGTADGVNDETQWNTPIGITFIPTSTYTAIMYVVETTSNIVRKIECDFLSSTYTTSTAVGTMSASSHIDGDQGIGRLATPINLVYAMNGVMMVSEYDETASISYIRKITNLPSIYYNPYDTTTSPPAGPPPDPQLSTLVGSENWAYQDASGPEAKFKGLNGIDFFDLQQSTLLVSDRENHVIRMINITTQVVTTWAGIANTAGNVDQSTGSKNDFISGVTLAYPNDIRTMYRYDANDRTKMVVVWVACADNTLGGLRRLRYIPTVDINHEVITITGISSMGQGGYVSCLSVAVDNKNNIVYAIYIDSSSTRIIFVKIINAASSSNPIATLIMELSIDGTGTPGISGTATMISSTPYLVVNTLQAATSMEPDLYFTDGSAIRLLTTSGTPTVSTVVGDVATGFADGYGDTARFRGLGGLRFMPEASTRASIYIVDHIDNIVRRITIEYGAGPSYYASVAIVGSKGAAGHQDGIPGQLAQPRNLVVGPGGMIYVTEGITNTNAYVRRVTGLSITFYDPNQSGSVSGDPQFVGIHGQSYQVHGTPGEVFNLITSPQLQVNSLFSYLDDTRIKTMTRCNKHVDTCYTHPGTYLTNLGINIWPQGQSQATSITVTLQLNNYTDWEMHMITSQKTSLNTNQENTYIVMDGNLKRVDNTSDIHNYIRTIDSHHFTVHVCHHLSVTFTLSPDGFFNLAVSVLQDGLLAAGAHRQRISGAHDTSDPPSYPEYPLHGLIGQTWKNVEYVTSHGKRYYEGMIDDYLIQDGTLLGTEFVYNQFPLI